jgi:hypothetical protein
MRKIDFTDDQIMDIISKYNNGLSTEKICIEYNTSASTISRILKYNGVYLTGNKKNIDEEKVILMYNDGSYTLSKICEIFGVSKHKIRTLLNNNGVKKKTSKKYNYNDNIFENIDNEEKAYWLGFLYADGYVRNRSGKGSELRLKLSIKDKDHLIKFKQFISSDTNIPLVYEENKNSKCYKVSINSNKIVKDLINKGCINKKSRVIKFPYFLDKKLIPHFIRGYFDGDGSISFSEKQIGLNIVSASIKFLKELAKELAKETNCKESNLVGSSNNFKYIQFSAKDDLYKLYDFLYKESNIYMDRKRDKYTYIVENYTSIKEIINKVRNNKNKKLINGK